MPVKMMQVQLVNKNYKPIGMIKVYDGRAVGMGIYSLKEVEGGFFLRSYNVVDIRFINCGA